MANVKVSAFPAAATLDGTEKVAGLQAGADVVMTAQAIANLANAGMTITTQTGTTYTLALIDAGSTIEFTNGSSITLTIPTNASVAFPIGTAIVIEQEGAGVITVAAAGGVTLRSAGSLVATNGQYADAVLVKRATNRWHLSGNLV